MVVVTAGCPAPWGRQGGAWPCWPASPAPSPSPGSHLNMLATTSVGWTPSLQLREALLIMEEIQKYPNIMGLHMKLFSIIQVLDDSKTNKTLSEIVEVIQISCLVNMPFPNLFYKVKVSPRWGSTWLTSRGSTSSSWWTVNQRRKSGSGFSCCVAS